MQFSMLPPVVKNLLIINGIMFLATVVLTNNMGIDMYRIFSLFYPDSPYFQPHQLVTHIFMHGNFTHIFFNMFALFMFGAPLENLWGSKRFLIYYFFTGFGAAALHTLVNAIEIKLAGGAFTYPVFMEGNQIFYQFTEGGNLSRSQAQEILRFYSTPTVGASGAVFGLLMAFGMMFPNTEIFLLLLPIPIKAKYFVIGYGAIELFSGFARIQGDNIAHFAHLGGMLFGFILIKYYRSKRKGF
ncbi:MAG: rhomboid family intramembrane serine protease [Luteibaculaceae bacterium]